MLWAALPLLGLAQDGSQALVLDGQDDAVVLDEESPFDFGDGFTIAFWMKVEGGAFATESAPLVTKGSDHWQIRRLGTSSQVAFVTGHGNSVPQDTLDGRTLIDDGAWHHVAVVYDDVEGEKALYVDGVSEGTATVEEALQSNDVPVRIGTGANQNAYFAGQIDDLRFWSTARSQTEIQHFLWHPLEGTEADLLAYYPADVFGAQLGSPTLQDQGPNNIHGSVEGDAELASTDTPRSLDSIRASDDLYEDRIELTWSNPADFAPESALLRVTRDGDDLAFRSTGDSTYTDDAAASDVTYTYCLEVETTNGTYTYGCDDGSRSFNAAVDVAASDEQYTDKIEITWEDRSSVEEGYRLYRNGTQIADLAVNTRGYVDEDSTLVPRTDYEYCVAPYDANGEGEQTCDVGRLAEVVPVASFSATTGHYDDRVALNWDDQGSGTTGFRVTRDGAEIEVLTDPSVTTYEDTSATPGETYTYCVIRQEGIIESTPICSEGSAGTLAAPTSVEATDERYDDRVELDWTDEAEVETNYAVYRQQGDRTGNPDSTAMTQIATLDTDAASYTDTDAETGQPYTYCVVATTEEGARTQLAGTDPVGRAVDACDLGTRSVILAPEDVTATDSTAEDRVTITWSDPATRSALYRVYRKKVGAATFTPIATPPNTKTEYVDENAEPNTRHEYCVTGLTSQGNESARTCDFGSREVLKPTDVTATDDEFEDRVRVEWTDASSVEVGYRIYRRPLADDGTPASADSTRLHTTVRNEIVLLDTTGTPGRDYRYSVETLVRFEGDTLSTSAGVDAGRRTLEKPTRVEATDGSAERAVTVTWRDNSGAEDGYRLWRVNPSGDTTLAGETESNVTSFADTSAALEVDYTYLVAAFDPYGTSKMDEDTGFAKILPPGSVSASDTYADSVTVTWVDQSKREAGYQIVKNGSVIEETGPNTTTYADKSIASGTSARYCIKSMSAEAGMSERVCDEGTRTDGGTTTVGGEEVALTDPITTGLTPGAFHGRSISAHVIDGKTQLVAGEPGNNIASGKICSASNPVGGAQVARRKDGEWTVLQTVLLNTCGEKFGRRVALSSDSLYLTKEKFLSTMDQYGYDRQDEKWSSAQTLFEDRAFGRERTADLAVDSSRVVLATRNTEGSKCSGCDRVLHYRTNSTETDTVADGEFFQSKGVRDATRTGGGVDVIDETIAMGNTQDNEVRLYTQSGGAWSRASTRGMPSGLSSSSDFGESVVLTEENLIVGAPGASQVYVYDVSGGAIGNSPQVLEGPGGSDFGAAVEIGSGGTLLVGAPSGDRAFLFQQDRSGNYEGVRVLTSNNGGFFGAGLAFGGGTVFVGAPQAFGVGAVYTFEIVAAPQNVAATDGDHNDRVELEWEDQSDKEDNYRVYRDGRQIATLGADATTYRDEDADPGDVSRYCVTAYNSDLDYETDRGVCDQGWRRPDGAVTGQVQQQDGSAFEGVDVCLTPNPNGALLFDGSGGYTIADDLGGDVPSTFTLETWVKPESDGRGIDAAWAFEGSDAQGSDKNLVLYDHDTKEFVYRGASGDSRSGSTFAPNAWHHVAVTIDEGQQEGTMYVDGEEEATFSPTASVVEGDLFTLGQERDMDGRGNFWAGQMDEVRLWEEIRLMEEMDSLRTRALTGEEDSLRAYWSLDERGGQAAANIVSRAGKYYAEYRNGVHPAQEGAPLEACVPTNADGNYTHNNLRYGDGIEFVVDPEKEPHTFRPGRSEVAINPNTPVQNQVTFTDQTEIPVSGTIEYASTECPVPNVEMEVDDQKERATDSEGAYKVGVLPGEHTIAPVLEGENVGTPHTFDPEQQEVEVMDQTTGVDFTDRTTNTLSVEARGGCGFSVGIAEVKIRATNGCLSRTVETDSTGMLKEELPPQEYTVQVTGVRDVPDPTQKPNIERFFERQGAYTVDLSESADTTLELIYRAPIEASVANWPGPDCEDRGVPVLERKEELDLDLKVFEDYGDGNLCPADSAQVTVYDELPDKGDEPVSLTTDSTGVAEYHTFARTPNLIEGRVVNGVDRSFQKSLTMIAEAGVRRDETTRWAIAEGTKPRKGTRFVTDPVDFPITVLRDPPGDQSFSYIEKDTEMCTTFFRETGFESVTSAAFKVGFQSETEVGWWPLYQDVKIQGTALAGVSVTVGLENETTMSTCMTANERLATSGDPSAIGRPADVFLGAGVNFVFSTSDVLQVEGEDASTCDIQRSQTTSFQPDSISTTFAYTRGHVEGTMIPTLRELKETSDEDRFDYDAAIRMWDHILYQSDSLASESEPVTNDNYENISLDENVSFNGGADYEYQHSKSHSSSVSTSGHLAISTFAELVLGPEEPVTSQFIFESERTISNTVGGGEEEETSTTWGFTLSDGDGGDNFTVDVKKDPQYGTPVFDTRSGQASCPYEPWREPFEDFTSFEQDREDWKQHEGDLLTTRRDKAELAVNGAPVQENVPHNEKARFGARLINDSPTDEKRKYELRMLNESNPKGAIVRVNGASISSGRPFWVEPKTASNLTLTVERGVEAFDYDSLGVMTYAPCGFFPGARSPTLDTMYVSVEFEPPSSPIDLRAPDDGFALNRVTKQDSIDVRLQDFSMDTTDTGHRVSEIGVFYRPVADPSKESSSSGAKAKATGADSTAADSAETFENGRYFSDEAARTLFGRLEDSAQLKDERGLGALEDWSEIFERARRADVLAQNGCDQEEGCDYEDIRDYFERTRFRDEDGVYELAAYTKTVNADGTITGAYVSDPIRMTVDTERPRVHGTPEPADGVLAKGNDVALTFDEDVDCTTLRPNENVTLTYADSADAAIPIAPTCDGQVVHLQPANEGAFEEAENKILLATVQTDTTDEGAVRRDDDGPVSLTDRVGNPLSEDVEWRFAVQRSGLVWEPPTDTIEMTEGTTAQLEADLVNYRNQPIRYSLDATSDGLVVEGPTEDPDPLAAGDVRTVQMTTEADREPGTYTDTLRAVGAGGDPVLFRLQQVVTVNEEAARTPANVTASAMEAQAVEVRWAAPDSAVERYELYRGETATLDTAEAPMASVEAGHTRYVDSTAQVGRTHYYWLVGEDAEGQRSRPSSVSEAFLYPLQLNVEAKRTFADGSDPQDYRLVALPGNVDRSLETAVSGTPGEDWTAYWDDGSTSDPLVSAEQADEFALEPGRGYWLRHDASWTVEDRVPTVSLQGDTVAVLDLHEGWNIISNPLDKEVDWAAVETANDADLQALWRFSGRYQPMDVFPSARTGEAFYFLNDTGLDSLAVPYPGAPFRRADSKRALAKKKATVDQDSAIVLATFQNGVHTSQASVGVDAEGAEGLDSGDQFAPPARFEGARLRMPVPDDTSAARRQMLAREMRPAGTRGQQVDLVLEAEPGARVRVDARQVDALGTAAVRLVNRATGRMYDLRQRQSVEVKPEAEETGFVLLFGTTAYVEEAWSDIVPPEVTLRPNYPNPFRTQTTIEYAVPEAASVRLEVYDVLGRRVATLVDGKKDAGWHREQWGAAGTRGGRVASGVYFGRLRVDDEVYTQKMVVVR